MSAIGSYEVLSRTTFDDCLEAAKGVRPETTGAWVFKKTEVKGLDGFQARWQSSVIDRVDFDYSGYVLGNYLDAQLEINQLQLFDEESEEAQTLSKVFTAAFVFRRAVPLPEMPDDKLEAFCRHEYDADSADLLEPLRAAHEFYTRGMDAITPDNLVVFVIR
jgi:hypothetical protein